MGSDLQIKKRDEIFHYIENLTKNHTTEFLDSKLSEKGCWSAPLKTHKKFMMILKSNIWICLLHSVINIMEK